MITNAIMNRGQCTLPRCISVSTAQIPTTATCSARMRRYVPSVWNRFFTSILAQPCPRDDPRVLFVDTGVYRLYLFLVRSCRDEPTGRKLGVCKHRLVETCDRVK